MRSFILSQRRSYIINQLETQCPVTSCRTMTSFRICLCLCPVFSTDWLKASLSLSLPHPNAIWGVGGYIHFINGGQESELLAGKCPCEFLEQSKTGRKYSSFGILYLSWELDCSWSLGLTVHCDAVNAIGSILTLSPCSQLCLFHCKFHTLFELEQTRQRKRVFFSLESLWGLWIQQACNWNFSSWSWM